VSRGGHTPVLMAEVVAALAPRPGSIIVDATFGAGGYAEAILLSLIPPLWRRVMDPRVARWMDNPALTQEAG